MAISNLFFLIDFLRVLKRFTIMVTVLLGLPVKKDVPANAVLLGIIERY